MIIGAGIISLLLTIVATASYHSYAKYGDVEIYVTDSDFKCDLIFCPSATDRCHVSKKTYTENPGEIVRKNICYSKDGISLLKSTTKEPNEPFRKVLVIVDTYRNGVTTSSDSTSFFSSQFNHFEQVGPDDANLSGSSYGTIRSGLYEVNKYIGEQIHNLWSSFASFF